MKSISINKPKFITIPIKKYILPTIFSLFIICLVIFSKDNLDAAKNGLILWANNVVPSLFPFFIATELLGYTDISYRFGKILSPIMKPLFNVSGAGGYVFLMGIISGYPVGAKIIADLRKENAMSKEECERLLSFTNNSGPLFVIGTVGISLFYNTTIGILLFITHILASISVGLLFRFWKYNKKNKTNNNTLLNSKNKNVSISNLGQILKDSIYSATNNILMIGGFVVLFSVIISILQNSNIISILASIIKPVFNIFGIENPSFSTSFVSGIFELTNGLAQIAIIPHKLISINIILTSFLLGFSGISIVLQVLAIISNTDISIKPYIIGKILHGIFACCYTYIFIEAFTIFNFNL